MPANDDDPLRIGAVGRPVGASAPAAAEGAQHVAAVDRVATEGTLGAEAVAEALAAGTIDGELALRTLVDQTAASVLGPGADPATVAAVRAEVEALLADDPTLAALLRA
jgi:hypothetical protein